MEVYREPATPSGHLYVNQFHELYLRTRELRLGIDRSFERLFNERHEIACLNHVRSNTRFFRCMGHSINQLWKRKKIMQVLIFTFPYPNNFFLPSRQYQVTEYIYVHVFAIKELDHRLFTDTATMSLLRLNF